MLRVSHSCLIPVGRRFRQRREVLPQFRADYQRPGDQTASMYIPASWCELCDPWQESICKMGMDKKAGCGNRFP